ncbi:ABC transporter substrate-binding protein [Azospirillum sp. TSH7]|uniref:extracellular solute-binding protein n=1 Tax=unclassified Azospirillum TaxID=2630922 RepID=UPI000D61B5EA|nr:MULTISPECIES: extracellular solute-binding protein [unclassified Azospirillum]PWC57139.1 ABC transporter substrate-binding protein [Azospirillum sp. TSH7]PWC67637.1 ABC transporter substrate-binding protein [Azospirillum sp. TSH20]
MIDLGISRRGFLAASVGTAGLLAAGRPVFAALQKPASPVTLNVVDVAGNLALTQKAIENYRKAKPDWVSRIVFSKAPAPELPGKLKAQQDANRVDIDLVLTGTDVLSAGIDQKLWINLLPDRAGDLPKLSDIYLEPAARMQGLAEGQGVVVTYYPSGPLFEYAPERVKQVPKTAAELLAWAKANPKRFAYARPANSGPGRTFLMGLPYILGDKDPKDPVNGWEKTWAYLRELGETIEAYPAGTTPTMKALGEGSLDIIVSTTGWDINPRVLGVVPKSAEVFAVENFRWVADAHYMCIPKGVSAEKLAVILDLMNHLLTPAQQAYTYDEGYFYPGPAVKGVTLAMAPKESQDAIAEFGRPSYDKLIADHPIELPLAADKLVQAFRRWDEEIGARKGK